MGENIKLKPNEEKVLNYIKDCVRKNGIPPSVREIGNAMGFSSSSSSHRYIRILKEKGYLEKDDLKPRALKVVGADTFVSIPVADRILVDEPFYPCEYSDKSISFSESLFRKEDLQDENFILKVKANTMIDDGIKSGDYVIVTRKSKARSGQTVVCVINNKVSIMKYFKMQNGDIILSPENKNMKPVTVERAEIVGKVIGVYRKIS